MPYRILIVEDETIIGLDLACSLEDAGFETVGIAKDMFAALEIASCGPVDLATMDVQLARGTNGVDTAVRLWQDHEIPSVFVSASIDPTMRERALAAEPLGFITKPEGADAVVAFVRSHFGA